MYLGRAKDKWQKIIPVIPANDKPKINAYIFNPCCSTIKGIHNGIHLPFVRLYPDA
jgi:hypothetical protein